MFRLLPPAFLLLILPLLLLAQDGSRVIHLGTATTAPLAESAPAGNAGLFVGVNTFDKRSGLADLRFAVNDAIGQAHLFVQELRLIPPGNCILAVSGEASSESARSQLAALQKAGVQIRKGLRATVLDSTLEIADRAESAENLVLLSLATHGYEDGNVAYAMPADGRIRLLKQTALDLAALKRALSDSKAGKQLMIVDACRERVFADGARSLSSLPMSSAFRRAFAGAEGQITLLGCNVGQQSFEDARLGHGIFTHFLINGLRGAAKADAQGFIRLGRPWTTSRPPFPTGCG